MSVPTAPLAGRMEGKEPLVVCVDDEARVLAALRRSLSAGPYALVTLERPHDALELAGRRPVSVLVTDQRMPALSGLELAREVRRISPRTTVFVLTAYLDTASRVLSGEPGVARLFTKPWDDRDLRAAIAEALGRPRDPADRFVRVSCAGTSPEDVLERVRSAAREARAAGLGLHVHLVGLPWLRGSVSRLLIEVARSAYAEGGPTLRVTDPSGYADTLFGGLGILPPPARGRPGERERQSDRGGG